MTYKSVVATRRGPPEVLEIRENDLREPLVGEVRVRTLAACVCGSDIQARYGQTPFPPRVLFVPGYAIIGDVDAVGEGVTATAVGNRVVALTVMGGWSEMVYLDQELLIPTPSTLIPDEAVTLVLNYLVAYQTLHRSARVTSCAVNSSSASEGWGHPNEKVT